VIAAAIATGSLAAVGSAYADTVVALPSPNTLPNSVVYVNGSAQVIGKSGGPGGITTYTLDQPGTYNFGQSFGALTPFTPPGGSSSYVFYVDYIFTIAPGTVDSLTSSINLGSALAVNGLQARLYEYNVPGGSQNLTLPAFSPNGPVLDAWSTSQNLGPGLTGNYSVIAPTTLAAGTYVEEIRATSVGTSGGSFSGELNLTPVPLPASLWLLLGGLGGLVAMMRQSKSRASLHLA
jgi:hypothetical protein